MTGHLGALPGIQVGRDFPPQVIYAVMQLFHLAAGFLVLSFEGLQAFDLLLDLFQFLLRFESRIHLDDIPIPAAVMRLHNREQELGPDDGGMTGVALGLVRSGYFRSIQGRTC